MSRPLLMLAVLTLILVAVGVAITVYQTLFRESGWATIVVEGHPIAYENKSASPGYAVIKVTIANSGNAPLKDNIAFIVIPHLEYRKIPANELIADLPPGASVTLTFTLSSHEWEALKNYPVFPAILQIKRIDSDVINSFQVEVRVKD
ncbi:MAG: hypothetical protein P3X22_001400 [Thermoprotei archaeon]|nr:hypothetical protein [Thermoprotei archaeon]